MTKRVGIRVAFAIAILFICCRDLAYAATPTETVRRNQTEVSSLLRQSPRDQAKIAALINEFFDYDAMAEKSLGSEWESRSESERAEFTELLRQLVRSAYQRNLSKTLEMATGYVAEEVTDDSVRVKTLAKSSEAREEPISIEYKLSNKDGEWRVTDIITEEVSLVSSYRSQFTKIIKNNGFAVLIQKMKDKIAKNDI
jgi:phospholipid transport system substrate-binding protein